VSTDRHALHGWREGHRWKRFIRTMKRNTGN